MPYGPDRPCRNRHSSSTAENTSELVPANILGSIEQLVRGIVMTLLNSNTYFSIYCARQYKAYNFSTASEITTSADWISRMERVFAFMEVLTVRRVHLAIDFLAGETYIWWESISIDFPNLRAMTWAQFRSHFEDRYLGRAIQDRLC